MSTGHTSTQVTVLSAQESAVIRTLMYFDVFNYPLTEAEILRSLSIPEGEVKNLPQLLASLEQKGMVFRLEPFWSLQPDSALAPRRTAGNQLFETRLKTAHRYSRLIGSFPYVRGVFLSGSISKGYMEPGADIDYFIVTQPGRLWVARTLLILFKKLVLLNSRRNFCVNYFIDTDHLTIPDQNIFTATEAAFLIPTYNSELYAAFVKANPWQKDYFPNFPPRDVSQCAPGRIRGLKWLNEKLMPRGLANRIDTWCMRRTMKRWKHKFAHFGEEKLNLALASEKNVSKHHPKDFRNKVLVMLEEKQAGFEKKFGVKLGGENA